jgi:hypothetical protein
MDTRLDFLETTRGLPTALARTCTRLPLAASESCEPRLATILGWYEDARHERRWPSWGRMNIGAIQQLADRMTALQVIALRQFRYTYVEFIACAASDDPVEAALDLQTRDDLQSVASLGTPRFDRIGATLEGRSLATYRLMLPLSRDGAAVNQILICRADR